MYILYFSVALFLFGLIFGSFINALVWRLRQQLDDDGEPRKMSAKKLHELSITKGRSMCPHCKHTLAPKDLVPLFSWLWLHGRCRYCNEPIGRQYPFIELLTGILFAVSYIAWPVGFNEAWYIVGFVAWLVIVVGLIALAVYDSKWMILPDRILVPLAIFATIAIVLQFVLGRPLHDLLAILFSVAIAGGIFCVLFFASAGKWIGFGDVKLGLFIGLVLGSPQLAILQMCLASILGLVWVLPGMLSKKMSVNSKVPFGPFLIAGTYIAMLWGNQIISLYTNLLNLIFGM